MVMLATRYGDTIDTKQFDGKGYGVFTQYVQKHYDRLFGKQTTDKTKFKVTLSARKEVTVYTDVTVEADNIQEAKQKALEEVRNDKYGFDWEDYRGDDEFIDSIDVDDAEEIEEADND